MPTPIVITAGPVEFQAELNDTPTAKAIIGALPIKGRANRWGDEIYFAIPVEADQEKGARQVVQAGELAYWPPGNAFCIFFGQTPVSSRGEIRAASPVNIIGRVQSELDELWNVKDGVAIRIDVPSEDTTESRK